MRYLLGFVIANITFQLVAYTLTVGYVHSDGRIVDFAGFAATGGVWTLAAAILAGFCFFAVITDPPLLGMARRMTGHPHLQHAIAYMGLAGVCFVPVAAFMFPLTVIFGTFAVVASGAFVGGFCRGKMLDRKAGMILGSEAFA